MTRRQLHNPIPGFLPDRSPNPLAGWMRRAPAPDGVCFSQRLVCSLRYLLAGIPGCGMICPILAGRE
jgi:ferric iron reductase protein FhuF